jgi:hypothetical protein
MVSADVAQTRLSVHREKLYFQITSFTLCGRRDTSFIKAFSFSNFYEVAELFSVSF